MSAPVHHENVLPNMTSHGSRPKGPQPVLDDLVGPTPSPPVNGQTSQIHREPASRTNGAREVNGSLPRRASQLLSAGEHEVTRSRSASPNVRPMMLRAKSDFGPRRDEVKNEETESKASTEGEWGLRHGFDTQLASEDQTHMLHEVRLRHHVIALTNAGRTSSCTLLTRSTRMAAIQATPNNRMRYKNGG